MKYILAIIVILAVITCAYASDEALLPDGINQILGRIQPNMSETQVEALVKEYYPNMTKALGSWSGQTGYVEFKVTSRHTISIAEYNDPKDFDLRFVHADMILYVYDWNLKRRLNLSFHNWDKEHAKTETYGTEQAVPGYPPQGVGSPEP